MTGIWGVIGMAQQAAIAVTGSANALYFGGRILRDRRPARQLAALVLCALFAGIAVEAAAHLGAAPSVAPEVARRAPLLLGSALTTALIVAGTGR